MQTCSDMSVRILQRTSACVNGKLVVYITCASFSDCRKASTEQKAVRN